MKPEEIKNSNLERVYCIKFSGYQFWPGYNDSGEQIVFGQLDAELLVAFFFSVDGNYLRNEFFPIGYQRDPNTSPSVQDPQQINAYRKAMRSFLFELEMTPGTIYVRHFAFPEWNIGIAEWPMAYFPEVQRALAAGEPFEDEFLKEWQEQKRWVMHWHQEFWMTEDGEVADT
jgi:hypothetical protein